MARSHNWCRWGAAGLAIAVGLGAAGPGCSTGPRVTASDDYRGPEVRLDSSGRRHIVVLTAPNPGWSIELDRVRGRQGVDEVFVTVRRPNPEFLYTQQVVEKRISTGVRSDQPVLINARTLDFANTNGAPYAPVVRSPQPSAPGSGGQPDPGITPDPDAPS